MKTVSFLSGYLLKTVLVVGLVVAAAIVGVGVAGFVAYRQVSVNPTMAHASPRPFAPAEEVVVPRTVALSNIETWEGQAIMMNVSASLAANRFIAAASSDQLRPTYATYQSDDRSATANPSDVPPSLEPSSTAGTPALFPGRPTLSDPGSHYIVDPNTGLVTGVDGTAGAQAEARQQQQEDQQRALVAATATQREREVRAALPVDGPAPASDLPPPKPDMFPAIRRAAPVDGPVSNADAAPAAGGFNAAAELTDDRPVFRAQPVTISQPVRTQRRIFALP